MIKTRVLPVFLAAVVSVCLNTTPFSLTVHAAEESCSTVTENESIADVSVCQNTDEPESVAAAEKPGPAESEADGGEEDANLTASEPEGTAEEIEFVESEPGGPTEEIELTGPESGGAAEELELAEPETGVMSEETVSADPDAEEDVEVLVVFEAGATEIADAAEPAGTAETTGAASDEHHLAFASDYHNTEGSIRNAFTGMPEDVEYVGMIGDMVGNMGNARPKYDSQMILDLVKEVFPDLDNTNVSIIWAKHDANVIDNAGIVKCMDGTGSGQIFTGTNADSSPAYYIYAIGHLDMSDGDETSIEAAAAFKTWVDGLDHTIPVIVLCHVPLQTIRGDNNGASYWNEALNYAATGVEGITSTDTTADIIRNVLYLYGHNHTVDRAEYYYGAGSTMNVQVDNSGEDSGSSIIPGGEFPPFDPSSGFPSFDPGSGFPPFNPGSGFPSLIPGRNAEGVLSNIYYTSLTAGYLKTSGNATLVTVSDGALTLSKYNGGQNVSLGTNGDTEALMGTSFTIAAQQHIHGEDVTENLVVATCDHDGNFDVAVYCTVCGKELYRSHVITGALGHSWSNWSVAREATETEEGEEVRTCSVCGQTEHRTIAKLQPQNPEKSGNPGSPEYTTDQDRTENAGSTEKIKSAASPLTGDESQWMLWLVALGLSVLALTAVTVSAGKRR